MSRPRLFTDDECRSLAQWWATPRTVRQKAHELGCSVSALFDAIARGQERPTTGERHKLRDMDVPRESPHSERKLATEELA